MGNEISKKDCINIDGVDLLTSIHDYTVERTSGDNESEWKLCDGTNLGGENPDPTWNFKSAFWNSGGGWRFLMHNKDGELPSFRSLLKIKPTEMKTQDEVNAWYIKVDEMLWAKVREQSSLKRKAAAEAKAAKEAAEAEARKKWISICYQDFDHGLLAKYNDGKSMHGFFKVVKKEDCHEFTIMECSLMHESWQNAVRNHEVWRFPLEVKMGVKGTTFECVTPDKIHVDERDGS